MLALLWGAVTKMNTGKIETLHQKQNFRTHCPQLLILNGCAKEDLKVNIFVILLGNEEVQKKKE